MTRLSAGFVVSAATIILTHYAAGGPGDLADVAVMHELGFSVWFSGALCLLSFG